jgi:DNA-directed RNA polymerase subunit omega
MNNLYLIQALQQVKNPNVLVNVVSQRVRQLGQGHRALVATEGHMSYMDIALKEIAEGKLSYEVSEPLPTRAAGPAKKRKR